MSSSLPALLMRYVAEELSRAPALIDRVFFVALNYMRQPRDRLTLPQEHRIYADLAAGLAQHRDRCASAFVDALKTQVQQDLAQQHEGYLPTEHAAEPSRLTLLDDTELAADVELTHVIEQINDVAEWELRELQTYTSSISGFDHVSPESNPLRGEIMARSLWYAADALPMSRGHQVVFMHVCGEALAGSLKLQYAAATTRLESLGVEPSRYRTGVPPSMTSAGARIDPRSAASTAAMRAPAAGGASALPAATSAAGADLDLTLDTVPMGLAGARNPTRAAAAPLVSATNDNAPAALSVPRSTASELQAARAAVERQVAELVNGTFDGFNAVGDSHPEMRGVLVGLRSLVLRQAQKDPSMLDEADHPAWQLLQRLLYQSACYPLEHDPRLAAYVSYASGLLDGSSALGDPGDAPLRRCIELLDAFALRQFEAQLAEAQADIAQVLEAERREKDSRQSADPMQAIFSPLMGTAGGLAGHSAGPVRAVDELALAGATWPAPADALSTTPAISPSLWLDSQLPGRWFRLLSRGRWVHVQLLWVSAAGEHWVFAGDNGGRAREVISRKLLLRLREDGGLEGLGERHELGVALPIATGRRDQVGAAASV